MDEIKTRLQDTSENCFKAYEAWAGSKKDAALRATLQETIHELRKVASRLEIEVAVSDRGDSGQKPMPIPSHRDSKRPSGNDDNKGNNAKDDNAGNTHNVADGLKPRKSGGRRGPRRASGGGSHGNKA